MLQQTQVVKVIEYFARFVSAFPTLKDLAEADEQQVLALWSGLGYYNRARNLHKAAKQCVAHHQGQLPPKREALEALPGIGRSTAAAICSLAFGQTEAIMDGNVKRVFARQFLVKGEPNKAATLKRFWQLAEQHQNTSDPKAYTQGLMDLGATICKKNAPACHRCPIEPSCQAKAQDVVADYPEKKKKVAQKVIDLHVVLDANDKGIKLVQRAGQGIWPTLWFLPEMRAQTSLDPMFVLTHKLTHRILNIHVYPKDSLNGTRIQRDDLLKYPHPKALTHILNQHDNHHLP